MRCLAACVACLAACSEFGASSEGAADARASADASASSDANVAPDGAAPAVSPCAAPQQGVVFCADFDAVAMPSPFGFTEEHVNLSGATGGIELQAGAGNGASGGAVFKVGDGAKGRELWLSRRLDAALASVEHHELRLDVRLRSSTTIDYAALGIFALYDTGSAYRQDGIAYYAGELDDLGKVPPAFTNQVAGPWHTVVVRFDREASGGKYARKTTIDGTPIDDAAGIDLVPFTAGDVRIGAFFAGFGTIELVIDNVVLRSY